jgi:hypothetical protein
VREASDDAGAHNLFPGLIACVSTLEAGSDFASRITPNT